MLRGPDDGLHRVDHLGLRHGMALGEPIHCIHGRPSDGQPRLVGEIKQLPADPTQSPSCFATGGIQFYHQRVDRP